MLILIFLFYSNQIFIQNLKGGSQENPMNLINFFATVWSDAKFNEFVTFKVGKRVFLFAYYNVYIRKQKHVV